MLDCLSPFMEMIRFFILEVKLLGNDQNTSNAQQVHYPKGLTSMCLGVVCLFQGNGA
jgi:hypothetical protein